ncbi:MAG: hypothetical protein K6T65_15445 [Peptococcaceae bacterium]|nr:hypothetical protein [Peptococcaceae bacterium]
MRFGLKDGRAHSLGELAVIYGMPFKELTKRLRRIEKELKYNITKNEIDE